MVEALEEERLRAARVQAVLEAAVTVSHEVNNPLTVLQLRLGRLMSSLSPGTEATEHLDSGRLSSTTRLAPSRR